MRAQTASMVKVRKQARFFWVAMFAAVGMLFALSSVLDVNLDAKISRRLETSLQTPQPLTRENQTSGIRSGQASDCAALHYSLPATQALPASTILRKQSGLMFFNALALEGKPVAVLLRPPIFQS